MKVSEVMSHHPMTVTPSQTLREAAEIMERLDTGFVPVGENDKLVGSLTDRDITVRGVAKGLAPDTKVGDIMTGDVLYCFEDDDVDTVAANLGDNQIRRMPVVDREKRLVGVVALGDLATDADRSDAAQALSEISQ